MASVNKVILIGNLGSDPEVRYLESGSAVAKFSIATTEAYNNKNGERIENTEWHRIELWEGLAKVAEKYLKKGSSVFIEGKIKSDKFTDKDGVEKVYTTIRGNSMTLLGGAPSSGYNQNAAPSGQPNQQRAQDPVPNGMGATEVYDDLPF